MLGTFYARTLRLLLVLTVLAFTAAAALAGLFYPQYALLVGLALAWRHVRRGHTGSNWTHGSATVASPATIRRGGLMAPRGFFIGKPFPFTPPRRQAVAGLVQPGLDSRTAVTHCLAAFLGPRWLENELLRVGDFVHIACFSPAGGGKGVSLVITNLLSYIDNVCVLDIKYGELHDLTARHRQERFGHRIITLAPFGINGRPAASDAINPLDFIDAESETLVDDCRELAYQIVTRTGRENDEHWVDSSVTVLKAMICFVCVHERAFRNLTTVRMVVASRTAYEKAVAAMQQSPHPAVRACGHQLTWFEDKERSSVLTTVQRFTEFLDSPPVARSVATSSFDPQILRTGKASLYLILPPEKVASLAPLLRLWIGTLMRVTTRGEISEKRPILWMLDEYAHVGRLQVIEDAVTLMRGMGVRLFFCFQSLGQVKQVFGDKADSILENIGTQIYFGVNSLANAEELSKRIGEMTISTSSYQRSTSDSRPASGISTKDAGSYSTSTSYTRSDMARRVLRAEELLTLDERSAVLLHRNLPVVFVRLIRYYEDKAFRRNRLTGRYGTGRQRGLGPRAGLAACLLVGVSAGALALAGHLAERATGLPVFPTAAVTPPAQPQQQWTDLSGEHLPMQRVGSVSDNRAGFVPYPVDPARQPLRRGYMMPGPGGFPVPMR